MFHNNHEEQLSSRDVALVNYILNHDYDSNGKEVEGITPQ